MTSSEWYKPPQCFYQRSLSIFSPFFWFLREKGNQLFSELSVFETYENLWNLNFDLCLCLKFIKTKLRTIYKYREQFSGITQKSLLSVQILFKFDLNFPSVKILYKKLWLISFGGKLKTIKEIENISYTDDVITDFHKITCINQSQNLKFCWEQEFINFHEFSHLKSQKW